MKKLLVLIVALAAAVGSAYYVYQTSAGVLIPLIERSSQHVADQSTSLVPDVRSEDGARALWVQEGLHLEDSSLSSVSASGSLVRSQMNSSAASTHFINLGDYVYAQYIDGVIGNGQRSLLFFYDATDAAKRVEQDIKKVFSGKGNTLASYHAYRVDFRSADELRKRYGVTKAGTLVLIDGKGTLLHLAADPTTFDVDQLLSSELR